ncbi:MULTISPECIES: AraC family transcriptional regulator [unclassified Clostridioides]|uniref:AraC family transcriptional regulator n=1 Tax=unclassified Clostridioides TaxID=2635829 RepID=UPI0007BBC5AC|nr:AraC family transcriptional regulator [Clostridioides sp. ZZV14-6387]MDB3084340.1 AraC family transcriptional regulator [Clostridioides difficile]NJJ35134.1 AraC family transcriptional regulator [Clostridioides difficile]NJK15607.1 AraC family transcriptional regulator [Clostridioides difficile]CZR99079.1 Melibiose operon regulatory protein [Clostridioides difficile]
MKDNIVTNKNKKEVTQQGSFEFPITVYKTKISENILGYIDWHWHEELQFCIVTKGNINFNVDGDSIILSEGEGIFINARQLHQAKNYKGSDCSYISVVFNSDFISSFAGSLINIKYIQPYIDNSRINYCILKNDIDWKSVILNNIFKIYEEYNKKEMGFELHIFILLIEVWNILIKSYFVSFPNDNARNNSLHIRNIIGYICDHYMEKIELNDLAKEVNLSKSTCCREFKKYMNCTIFEYIINYRLVASSNLLISTNDSISDIAYQCGFGSTSYFIEKFKMKTGVSPSIYRRQKTSF